MTVNEAIAAAVHRLGDTVSRDELTEWLSEIENTVVREIGETHFGQMPNTDIIKPDTDGERVLFAPDPHSRLYLSYLLMKADLYLCDTEQYANSAAVFSEAYKSFADWYNRAYMPLGERRIRV
ncbi:MAG: hypothetical protein IJV70_03000 [Clostridia bacterium]|nr:hypothetical protein [Clostridia bacterium]